METCQTITDIKWRLVKFCKEKKITHENMAKKLGYARQSVDKWFDPNCDTMIHTLAIRWLMIDYDLDVRWLLLGDAGLIQNAQHSNIINQSGNIGGDQTAMLGKNCSVCPLPKTVEILTEQNKKLTDKLIDKL